MPQMVLLRNFILTSNIGHSIAFKKGVPVGVPPKLVPRALEIGATFVEESKKEAFLPQEVKPQVGAPMGDDRETRVLEAIRQVVEKNDSADFTAGGKPKFKVVSTIAGFRVDAEETVEMWRKYNEMQADLAAASKMT